MIVRPMETYVLYVNRVVAEDEPLWRAIWHEQVDASGYLALEEPVCKFEATDFFHRDVEMWAVYGRAIDLEDLPPCTVTQLRISLGPRRKDLPAITIPPTPPPIE